MYVPLTVNSNTNYQLWYVEGTCLTLVLERIWKNKNNNDKRIIPTYLLAYLLTLIVKELKLVLSWVGWYQH